MFTNIPRKEGVKNEKRPRNRDNKNLLSEPREGFLLLLQLGRPKSNYTSELSFGGMSDEMTDIPRPYGVITQTKAPQV
jgi:hypothetical protein